jgi:RsiW-degrading membrane proteinase PrsW (M82 family)
MKRRRVHYPLKYRRARTAIYAVMLFWLWTWLGSAAFIASLFNSPIHAIIAMYALFTFVLLSIPAFLLALAQMALNRPVVMSEAAVVIRLDRDHLARVESGHAARSAS